ncbi:MAG: flagellar motor protein MotB [Myxococcota bacterium]|nr:flagellar motor protein MotB [Myxococcota bacterium]
MVEVEEEEGGSEPGGAPAWMATMADLMSLLLTFFVLLLSFANMDVVKFRVMLGSVQDAFGVQREHPGDFEARATTPVELSIRESTAMLEAMENSAPQPPPRPAPPMDPGIVRKLEDAVNRLDLGRVVEVEPARRGVVVRVKGQLLFDSGSARLRAEALVFMDEIARMAKLFPYGISIEGHTDDVPISTPEFPTNWHLSAGRAISSLRYLVDVGEVDASRLSAAGFADTRPLVANDSTGNRSTNRRVEFVFLRDDEPAPPRL